ncbi:hypothetical protein DC897_RS22505 [Vibrio parahaemolyticus]|uniref:hypothetical protein n=1 Tax=Vibrio TaxID=662 RepID=UPI000812F8B7|nr:MULTISPECIES: hypothetical protein [Vibrio]EGQ8312397.1 hypothetical protein [Vibrio parahaemolyticus]EGQ8852918.1 hypothetical protein [Vibrio parahaemolyticus]EGQ8857567.1 hypothetical protein [Vibrio parahaemolyticus]EGQ8876992.1 hypothetical protein [Vibrio parahaemolyticus]EGQ8996191.1 hypothetical protein [Vibrio parahaemolyticus]
MVNFVLGLLCGFMATIWYLVFDFSFDFDHGFSVNVVIAAATIIATAIHFDSVRKQRKDRLWEINKESLLKLSKAISDSVEMTGKLADSHFNQEQGIPDHVNTDGSGEIHANFKEVLSDSLYVYKPLLSPELISAIEDYQTTQKKIEEAWEENELSTFAAYDEQWAAQKKLQEVVASFIKQVSGV